MAGTTTPPAGTPAPAGGTPAPKAGTPAPAGTTRGGHALKAGVRPQSPKALMNIPSVRA